MKQLEEQLAKDVDRLEHRLKSLEDAEMQAKEGLGKTWETVQRTRLGVFGDCETAPEMILMWFGRLFKPDNFKTRHEMAIEQLVTADEFLTKATEGVHRTDQEIQAMTRRIDSTKQEIIEKASKIEELEFQKSKQNFNQPTRVHVT